MYKNHLLASSTISSRTPCVYVRMCTFLKRSSCNNVWIHTYGFMYSMQSKLHLAEKLAQNAKVRVSSANTDFKIYGYNRDVEYPPLTELPAWSKWSNGA